MSFGITTYRANGSVMLDGLSKGGILIDVLVCPVGTSGTQNYPRTNSPADLWYSVAQPGSHDISLVSSLGNGAVQWTSSISIVPQQDTILFVFARNLVSADQYGMQYTNDAGEVLADQGYPSPQFAGACSFATTASYTYNTPDGYQCNIHNMAYTDLARGEDKILLLALPDSGSDDTWYCLSRDSIPASENIGVIAKLYVYTKATSYLLPSLHVYTLNNPVASTDTMAIRLFDASGALTFDSSAETLCGSGSLTVNIPAYGATNTYTLPASSGLAMSVPYLYKSQSSSNRALRYRSAAKRVGNQYTITSMYDSNVQFYTGNADYTYGGNFQRYSPVADVSQQSPSNPAGARAASTSTFPNFDTQPSNASGPAGTAVTFSCSVSGSPAPSLQWFKKPNGGSYYQLAGENGSSYTFTPTLSDNNAYFYCEASNAIGVVDSVEVFYLVDDAIAPTITSMQPSSGSETVASGTSVTLSFSASGSPTPTCEIYVSGSGGALLASGTGSVSYTYTATSSQSYIYKATNVGSGVTHVTEQNVSVTVSGGGGGGSAPVITTQPTSTSTTQNGSASFTCVASGATSYQWYRDGSAAGTGSTISPDTSSVGTFTYYCVASNSYGSTTSSTASLVVNAPSQSTYPSYNSISGEVDNYNGGTVEFDMFRNGTYTGGSWANGSGDGTLYDVMATASPSFTPASGSFALGTWYSFASYSGVGWIMPGPTSTGAGVTRTSTLSVSVRLRSSGAIVSSGSVTLLSGNDGGVPP